MITQVLFVSNGSAFQNLVKSIAIFYPKEEAMKVGKEKNYQFVEDSGRGYNRGVVPSPRYRYY